jgi:hypothetical protein
VGLAGPLFEVLSEFGQGSGIYYYVSITSYLKSEKLPISPAPLVPNSTTFIKFENFKF